MSCNVSLISNESVYPLYSTFKLQNENIAIFFPYEVNCSGVTLQKKNCIRISISLFKGYHDHLVILIGIFTVYMI